MSLKLASMDIVLKFVFHHLNFIWCGTWSFPGLAKLKELFCVFVMGFWCTDLFFAVSDAKLGTITWWYSTWKAFKELMLFEIIIELWKNGQDIFLVWFLNAIKRYGSVMCLVIYARRCSSVIKSSQVCMLPQEDLLLRFQRIRSEVEIRLA